MRVRCPENLRLTFASIPPYVYKTGDSRINGVFGNIIPDAINFWCNGQTNITYIEIKSGLSGLEQSVMNATADIFFPIPSIASKKFYIGRPFIPIVETPGMAFYTSIVPDAGNAIGDAVSNGWPALVFVIMSAMIAGMIYWLSDLARQSFHGKKDPSIYPKFSLEGPFKGFYWAMVSMTTVGYGDFYPKSMFGRLLATIWILMGIVIISLFTATVTTILLAACLANDVTVNGARVAVMENSIEYNYAVKKNALPEGHETIDQLLESAFVSDQAVLLDSFVAGYYQEKVSNLRLVEVIEYVFSYGLVLENKGLWLEPNIRAYIRNNKEKLFQIMSSTMKPLKSSAERSEAEAKSTSLLSIQNKSVFLMLIGTTSLIGILSVLGMLFDRWYLRKRSRDSKDSKKLKETIAMEDTGIRKAQLREQLKTFSDIKKEVDSFLDLIKVKMALNGQFSNGNFHMDDDVAISNIELIP